MPEELLTSAEVAVLLRRKTPAAIRNMVLRRQIPYRKIGGKLLFLRREIMEMVERAPGMTVQEWRKRNR